MGTEILGSGIRQPREYFKLVERVANLKGMVSYNEQRSHAKSRHTVLFKKPDFLNKHALSNTKSY